MFANTLMGNYKTAEAMTQAIKESKKLDKKKKKNKQVFI